MAMAAPHKKAAETQRCHYGKGHYGSDPDTPLCKGRAKGAHVLCDRHDKEYRMLRQRLRAASRIM